MKFLYTLVFLSLVVLSGCMNGVDEVTLLGKGTVLNVQYVPSGWNQSSETIITFTDNTTAIIRYGHYSILAKKIAVYEILNNSSMDKPIRYYKIEEIK